MKGLDFPITSLKVKGLKTKYDLNSPQGRTKYFQAKVSNEVKIVKNYLKKRTFIAYMIGKKGSGKGTYSQIFGEVFGAEKIALVSVGDLVRDAFAEWKTFKKTKDYERLKSLYRGYISFSDAENALLGKSQTKLLPTEFILALLKLRIEKLKGKTIFIDGLPREHDQVSYSLYFRDLIEYRDDPDVFVLIDIPEKVIDERIRTRVVCPKCKNTKSTKLNPTSKAGYDKKTKEFYLICDNPDCTGKERMVPKEGDDMGIEPIRPRLEKDEEILRKTFTLHGIPRVLIRNYAPVNEYKKYFDDYEVTQSYSYKWDYKNGSVKIIEDQWTISDDNGVKSISLLAAPAVASMIKQLSIVLK